jgi:hypothetical protein
VAAVEVVPRLVAIEAAIRDAVLAPQRLHRLYDSHQAATERENRPLHLRSEQPFRLVHVELAPGRCPLAGSFWFRVMMGRFWGVPR